MIFFPDLPLSYFTGHQFHCKHAKILILTISQQDTALFFFFLAMCFFYLERLWPSHITAIKNTAMPCHSSWVFHMQHTELSHLLKKMKRANMHNTFPAHTLLDNYFQPRAFPETEVYFFNRPSRCCPAPTLSLGKEFRKFTPEAWWIASLNLFWIWSQAGSFYNPWFFYAWTPFISCRPLEIW